MLAALYTNGPNAVRLIPVAGNWKMTLDKHAKALICSIENDEDVCFNGFALGRSTVFYSMNSMNGLVSRLPFLVSCLVHI